MNGLFDESEVAQVEATRRGLHDLQGSPKQVAWGQKIRNEKFRDIDRLLTEWLLLIERYRERGNTEAAAREAEGRGDAMRRMEHLEQMDHAAWWIERRLNTERELLSEEFDPNPGRG